MQLIQWGASGVWLRSLRFVGLCIGSLCIATVAGAASRPDRGMDSGLFSVHYGLPCHTSGYAPRRLVWVESPALTGVRAVQPHPEVAETVYAVTDGGVYRSDDFADSWRRLPLAAANSLGTITGLAFQPGAPETFCLGTRSNGVWISRDGGGTVRQVGSRARGMAADNVESLVYAPGDLLHRTILVAHGRAATGISSGDTRDGTWTVATPEFYVFRIVPGSQHGRDLCVFAAEKANPEVVGVYYASVLGAYWQRQLSDVSPTDGAWYQPAGAFYVTTLDKGVLRIGSRGGTLQELGGADQAWFSVGATWDSHADAPVIFLYQPTVRGVVWTTNDLTGTVEQGRGLYRGSFVSDGSQVRANAGGTRFYGAINGALWVARDADAVRVEAVTFRPSTLTVSGSAFDGGFWKSGVDALREFAAARRAAPQAGRISEFVHTLNAAIPNGPVHIQARVVAPDGVVPTVTADLSRLGLSAVTPLVSVSNGLYEARFDVTPEGLGLAANHRGREWRPSWPGTLPVTVTACSTGQAPVGGIGMFSLYMVPEPLRLGRDHWALGLGETTGKVSFACERDSSESYRTALHQRLTVGPGVWRAQIGHSALNANIANYDNMTFLIRSLGRANADLVVQLTDKPADMPPSATPGVSIVAGGYLAGGAITTEYRRVTIPVADLLKGATTFDSELFNGVVFSGNSATNCTYLIDDWHFDVSKPGSGTPDEAAPLTATLGNPASMASRQASGTNAPTAGDDADASLQRGNERLAAGDPRGALGHFADALRRCSVGEVGGIHSAILTGFHGVNGPVTGLVSVGQFIAYGPNGPDGKTRTEDPFALLGLTGTSRQPGGLVPLAADEIAAMQKLVPELREAAGRRGNPALQVAAIDAYRRACEALIVFDRDEALAWIFAGLRHEADDRVLGAWVRLGQAVAKSDRLDLSGVHAFESAVMQVFEEAGEPVPGDVLKAFQLTERVVKNLMLSDTRERARATATKKRGAR